jgi:hypothetical protein
MESTRAPNERRNPTRSLITSTFTHSGMLIASPGIPKEAHIVGALSAPRTQQVEIITVVKAGIHLGRKLIGD